MIALFPFDKAIRTGANGVLNEGVLVCFNNSFGNDCRKGNCKVAEGRCVRSIRLHCNSVFIVDSNIFNKVDDIGDSCGVASAIQRELDIFCRQITAVMELDALTNLEHIGLFIRLLPTFGDLRNDLIGFSVNCHQGVKNLTGDLNCRCFFALMGVKRGDISALRPDQCVFVSGGSRFRAAAVFCRHVGFGCGSGLLAATGHEGQQHNQRQYQGHNADKALFHTFSSCF